MRKIFLICISSLVLLLGMSSCISSLKNKIFPSAQSVDVYLNAPQYNAPNRFSKLDKPIKVVAESDLANSDIFDASLSPYAVFSKSDMTTYIITPSVKMFAQSTASDYMEKMKFDVSPNGDFTLYIKVNKFRVEKFDKSETNCIASLSYRVTDRAGENVIPSGTAASKVTLEKNESYGDGLGRAYVAALDKINWDRIAGVLTVASSPKDEKNQMVKGNGDTALEHTVIRWFIESAPQGADVSWRVISSTPEVSNTNANYVGTTPYESTESFDIKGLTYQNSGNVQIEVTCEKAGYLAQRKRFNLRQVIDQKEISAKYNLIKE